MLLEHGKTYKNRSGKQTTVFRSCEGTHPFLGTDGRRYMTNGVAGTFNETVKQYNLIELVPVHIGEPIDQYISEVYAIVKEFSLGVDPHVQLQSFANRISTDLSSKQVAWILQCVVKEFII